jgi:hypothetical protein
VHNPTTALALVLSELLGSAPSRCHPNSVSHTRVSGPQCLHV